MIDQQQAETLVKALEDAWNGGDGRRYAAPFADDADFVTVAGLHARGRQAIADNHDRIFSTIYKSSRVSMSVEQLRSIGSGLSLLHIGATLEIPGGPLAGTMQALMTTVVDNSDGQPAIVSLHNTIVRDLAQAAGR
jgi:uncharacterized protein (TIGR02246 family)